MKRKILSVLCLVMLLLGLAGPRPVEAQNSGCVEYTTFQTDGSGYKYPDLGSAYQIGGDWWNDADFYGKYYYFYINGSWISFDPVKVGVHYYDTSDHSEETGHFANHTSRAEFYARPAYASGFTSFELCNTDTTSTPTSTSTSTATSTPTITPTGPTAIPTQVLHYYKVNSPNYSPGSTGFDTYASMNACPIDDLFVGFGLTAIMGGTGTTQDYFHQPDNWGQFSDKISVNSGDKVLYLLINSGHDDFAPDFSDDPIDKINTVKAMGSDWQRSGNHYAVVVTDNSYGNVPISSYLHGYEFCYGNHEGAAAPTITPTPTPTPEPGTCKPLGSQKTIDLLNYGWVVAGSMIGYLYSPGDDTHLGQEVIQFSDLVSLPQPVMGIAGKEKWADLQLTFDNDMAGTGSKDLYFSINGSTEAQVVGNTSEVLISIPSTSTSLYIDLVARATVDDRGYAFHPKPPRMVSVTGMKLTYASANPDENLICDGDMEQLSPDLSYWIQSPWARGNLFNPLDFLMEGAPACGNGYQMVGKTIYYGLPGEATNKFVWGGGNAYFKFRYRSKTDNYFAHGGTPHVYLVDADNNFVMDLYGSNSYDAALLSPLLGNFANSWRDWELVTGSVSLSPGIYKIALGQGFKFDGAGNIDTVNSGTVYFDDVAIGTMPLQSICDTWLYIEPPDVVPTEIPTWTPTGTVPTPTMSITPSPTPDYTLTPTRTLPPARTGSPLPTMPGPGTSTLYPTRTVTPGGTVGPGPTGTLPIPSGVPNPTNPVYGTSTPGTALPPGTPCPPGQQCTWTPGDYPVDPYIGPGGDLICPKPANAWSLAAWLDYERCMIEQFVWWGPSQQATLQAIPTLLSSKEPFNTIGQISDGVQKMQTEVATVQWGSSGMVGMNDPVTQSPNQILKPLIFGQSDPWGTGRINLGLHASSPALSVYCSTKLSSLLSARLSEGMCFALNLMMGIGYLPWIQMLVNIMCIWGIVRECLSIFGIGRRASRNGN